MRFSTRVFLGTSLISVASVGAASALIGEAAQSIYRHHYEIEYRQRLESLAADFVHLESAYDQVALNAAHVVADAESRAKGNLSGSALAQLAQTLGVERVSIVDSTGITIQASDGKPNSNLFSLCPSYKELVSGKTDPRRTPLVPDQRDLSSIAKYTMIPSLDHKNIIDVGVSFNDLSRQLQRTVEDESDIVRIRLLSPSGQLLGDVRQNESIPAKSLSQIRATVPANETDCCECKMRHLTNGSDPYTYQFVADVSQASLHRAIDTLRARFFLVLLCSLALALLASFWVSRALVRKIEKLRGGVDHVALAGDFSRFTPLTVTKNGDEIDALAQHFNDFFKSMKDSQSALIEAKKSEAKASIASQVAHDIRSPLTAMTLALTQLKENKTSHSEMISILSHAISRVSGIVKRLSQNQAKTDTASVETPRLTLIDKLLSDVAQEHALKVSSSRKFKITGFDSVPHIWAVVQATEIQAALSNLLNNAFEACGAATGKAADWEPEVLLDVKIEGKNLRVTLSDNGVGIPPENITHVFDREFTSGKKGGSGLGLYQAKKAVEWTGGNLSIELQVGKGTAVTLFLPIERAPQWATDRVEMRKDQLLIVADDDPQILSFWTEKSSHSSIEIRTFDTIGELDQAMSGLAALSCVFILDQHAGEGLTGTGFIEKHSLGARSFLSTSEFDDPLIQDKIRSLKTKMIPKPRLQKVQIVVQQEKAQSEKGDA
jgi:signal transduction histidine kinase